MITAEVKPDFIQSVSILVIIKVTGVLCYFGGFPDDAGSVGPDADYNLCSVEVNIAFCLSQVFGYRWFLVQQSGASDVFRNPVGYGVACLAYVHTATLAGYLVNCGCLS
jgi:hypothetical protein